MSSQKRWPLSTASPSTPPRKRVTFAADMDGQGQPAHTAAETVKVNGQTNGHAGTQTQVHTPYPARGHTQTPMANSTGKSVDAATLAQAFGALSLHGNHPGGKYMPVNGPGPGIDGTTMQRPQGQYMVVPNGTMVGPMPAYAPITPHRSTEQGSSLQYLQPTFYPGMVPGAPIVPGPAAGYPWPYHFNAEAADHPTPHRDSWPLVDEHHPGNYVNGLGQPQYYPAAAGMDPYHVGGHMYNGSPVQYAYQVMRTNGGYALHDIDALVKQDPPIPPPVPAMWSSSSKLTLAKCLENREGITNVYIRGFLPETTDELLYAYASRFGKIERCKAIVDLETGLCKGFGFVQFYSFDACENCIRGFFHLGYQASFAQKSRNSRLKDLEDKSSTNIYCTNVPIEWTEADLRRHFEPYRVVSERISRDEHTGVSKEVGFARFESREVAVNVLAEFHNVTAQDGVKLLLRFADTKAQKQLKQQSSERRAYRAGEYNYSVEVVQGTPSPGFHRLRQAASHFSPNSQGSYPSPLGMGQVWTPATSISPPGPIANKQVNGVRYYPVAGRPVNLDGTPTARGYAGLPIIPAGAIPEGLPPRPQTDMATIPASVRRCKTPSPMKANLRAGTASPVPSRREIHLSTPKSSV